MSNIIVRRPWTRQPPPGVEENQSLPFLFAATAFGKGLIDGARNAYYAGTSGTSVRVAQYGRAIVGGTYAGSDGVPLTNNELFRFDNSPGTIIAHIYTDSVDSGSPIVYSVRNSSVTTLSCTISDNKSTVRRSLDLQIDGDLISSPSEAIWEGKHNVVSYSWGEVGMRIFSSRIGLAASNSLTVTPNASAIQPWMFNRSTGGRGFSGAVISVFGFTRQLHDSYLLRVCKSPEALYSEMFKRRSALFPGVVGVTAPTVAALAPVSLNKPRFSLTF